MGTTPAARPSDAVKLRNLASWFREFAEQAGNPAIWEARLHTAEKLEAEADLLDHRPRYRSGSGARHGRHKGI